MIGLYLELQRQEGYDRAHESKMIALAYEAGCAIWWRPTRPSFPHPDDFEAHDALMAVAGQRGHVR
jgi:DNA polymerase-3 subunit alpha